MLLVPILVDPLYLVIRIVAAFFSISVLFIKLCNIISLLFSSFFFHSKSTDLFLSFFFIILYSMAEI